MNALDEIDAIRAAYLALEPLTPAGRTRALTFLGAKLEGDSPPIVHRQVSAPPPALVERVVRAVSAESGVSVTKILSKTRRADVCLARFAVMFALREKGLTLPAIGRALGRDHSTVLHGLNRAAELRNSVRFKKLVGAANEQAAA